MIGRRPLDGRVSLAVLATWNMVHAADRPAASAADGAKKAKASKKKNTKTKAGDTSRDKKEEAAQ